MIQPNVGVWMQRWVEYESGFGRRHDGCFLYPTQEAAEDGTRKIAAAMRKIEAEREYGPGNPPNEYSAHNGEPIFMQVEPELAKEVAEKGEVYKQFWIQ